jgi:hypothetical protein
MTLREQVENNIVFFLLGFLVAGFGAGIGAYKEMLAISNSETVYKGTYILKEDLANNYVPRQSFEQLQAKFNDLERKYEALVANPSKWNLREQESQGTNQRRSQKPRKILNDLEDPNVEKWVIVADPFMTGTTQEENLASILPGAQTISVDLINAGIKNVSILFTDSHDISLSSYVVIVHGFTDKEDANAHLIEVQDIVNKSSGNHNHWKPSVKNLRSLCSSNSLIPDSQNMYSCRK